jgi:FMN phosphatase YigB (HAD superfamily)
MRQQHDVAFLLDVDNTLLDNDGVERDLRRHLEQSFGVERLRGWGPTVILSDGDVVFQPRKVERSGLWEAVHGHVLIYVHKEQMLQDVEQRYPARHYVMVDDKLRILAASKQIWGDRLTTVFPRQGHYAHDPKIIAAYPPATSPLSASET